MRTDLAIIGVGPAALLLAVAAAERGLQTLCIGSDLRRRWTTASTGWRGGALDALVSGCSEMSWAAPTFVGPDGERLLDGRYVRVDAAALQPVLERRCDRVGVRFVTGVVTETAQGPTEASVTLADGRQIVARHVVRASGHAPQSAADTSPLLTAVGLRVSVPDHPWFPGEMVVVDARAASEDGPASFGQVMPLAHDTLFVQEVSLAGPDVASPVLLRARIDRRLSRAGVRTVGVEAAQVATIALSQFAEEARQGPLAFGPAAGMVHPLTGQSLAIAAERAPAAAEALRTGSSVAYWQAVWPDELRARHAALATIGRHLSTLDQTGLADFFDAFYSLPTDRWRGCLDGSLSAADLADLAVAVRPASPSLLSVAGA